MSDEGLDQVRAQLDQVTKDLKKAQTEAADLLTKNRKLEAQNAFRDAELSPSLADLFVAVQPEAEITVEAAKTFAETYGVQGLAPEGSGEGSGEGGTTPPAQPATDTKLSQMGKAGSRGGDGGRQSAATKTYTTQEWVDLQRNDPAAAEQVRQEGRIALNPENRAGPRDTWVKRTGSNPFLARLQSGTEQS